MKHLSIGDRIRFTTVERINRESVYTDHSGRLIAEIPATQELDVMTPKGHVYRIPFWWHK